MSAKKWPGIINGSKNGPKVVTGSQKMSLASLMMIKSGPGAVYGC